MKTSTTKATKIKMDEVKAIKAAFETATFEGVQTTSVEAYRIQENKIVNGENKCSLHCSCGYEYKLPLSRNEEYQECPQCGSHSSGTVKIDFANSNGNQGYYLCRKTGYAIVPWEANYALIEVSDDYTLKDNRLNCESKVQAQCLILFNGIKWEFFPCSRPRYYWYSHPLKTLAKRGKETISRASDLLLAIRSHDVIGKEGLPFNLEDVITEATKEPVKKTVVKKTLESLNDKLGEVSTELLKFPQHVTISTIVKADENGTQYLNKCCCGRETTSSEPEAVCEDSQLIQSYRGNYASANLTEKTHVIDYLQDDDIFVVRTFVWSLAEDMSTTIEETERLFIGLKVKEAYSYSADNGWVKASSIIDNSAYKPCGCTTRKVALPIAEESLDKSFLKYASCKEIWAKMKHEDEWDFSDNSYIQSWLERPIIESLYKLGLARAYDDVKRMSKKEYKETFGSKKSLAEVYGINKQVLKMARELDCGLVEIQQLQKMWNADQTITTAVYTILKNGGNTAAEYRYGYGYGRVDVRDLAVEIKLEHNIPFARQIEYIQNVVGYQCIEFAEAYRIWKDYLNMAKDIKLNISKASLKYPASLKLEHDKATFIAKSLQAEIDREHFQKAAKESKKYEYSLENLFAKVPETPEEMIDEGNQQSHCVANYVQQVRDMKTTIVFIRYKDDPDTSFYTVEIKNDSIQQLKGFGNRLATEPEVLKFVAKWMKAKNLKKNTCDF